MEEAGGAGEEGVVHHGPGLGAVGGEEEVGMEEEGETVPGSVGV